MNQTFAKNLSKGDVIVVPYNSRLWAAIFDSFGPKGTPRFYLIAEYRIENVRKVAKGEAKTVYRDYITRDSDRALAKISIDDCDVSVQRNYDELVGLLKATGKL